MTGMIPVNYIITSILFPFPVVSTHLHTDDRTGVTRENLQLLPPKKVPTSNRGVRTSGEQDSPEGISGHTRNRPGMTHIVSVPVLSFKHLQTLSCFEIPGSGGTVRGSGN